LTSLGLRRENPAVRTLLVLLLASSLAACGDAAKERQAQIRRLRREIQDSEERVRELRTLADLVADTTTEVARRKKLAPERLVEQEERMRKSEYGIRQAEAILAQMKAELAALEREAGK
jgi:hypothetical protein